VLHVEGAEANDQEEQVQEQATLLQVQEADSQANDLEPPTRIADTRKGSVQSNPSRVIITVSVPNCTLAFALILKSFLRRISCVKIILHTHPMSFC
jgi:hypothetical protein